MNNINLFTIFLTGLLTGGLTCMAVQGGLLTATLAQRTEDTLKEKARTSHHSLPIISFLVAKLIAYTVLGFLLGSLGSIVSLSLPVKIVMQVAVAIFMLGTALNILEVHPLFRYFNIQPPRFLTRFVRKQSKSKDIFAPAILGALTIFIPCGTTQAMMALSIGSGNPFLGAAVLFSFVLGTSPIFFLLGYFTTKLGSTLNTKFMRFAAYAIIILAIFNINNAIALSGSQLTLENAWKNVSCSLDYRCNNPSFANSQSENPVNETTITIRSSGYYPSSFTVKSGSNVTLHLKNIDGASCVQAFLIPKLRIEKIVSPGAEDTITFKAPDNAGSIPFMCSMGMFRGVINVI